MFWSQKRQKENVNCEPQFSKDNLMVEKKDFEFINILSNELHKNIENVLTEESKITYGFHQVSKTLTETTNDIKNIEESMKQQNEDSSTILKEISDSIELSQDKIQASREMVNDSTQRITHAFGVFEHILEVSSALSQKYEDINKFAKVITDISYQTNLLSLNASIEAARAGEAGKGFAVVANEIKSLSDTTRNSASDIIRLLDEMSQIMNSLKEESDKGKDIVTIANDAISSSNESFNRIAEAEKNVYEKLHTMESLQLENSNKIKQYFSYMNEKLTTENSNMNNLLLDMEHKSYNYTNIINQLDQIEQLSKENK